MQNELNMRFFIKKKSFEEPLPVAVRRNLAKSLKASPETLAELAKDEDKSVRVRVAQNKNTPPETLAELSKDENDKVRYYVSINQNISLQTLTELAKDEYEDIRSNIAIHPNTPLEVLAELAKDNLEVRLQVAANVSTPPKILAELAKDENVRHTVAGNLNTSLETLAELAKDEDKWVREAVVKNPNTPLETREIALIPRKELTKETIEVPYADLLNKYTEDEIFDIAAGRKTDVTKEEVEQAKDVISRGIVANRLSMRKFSQSTLETIQKAQAGDESAIAQVIEENTGLISQALINWGYTPESDEFQDTISDIKVEIINRIIPQYDPSKGAFSTFLSTSVYNFLRRGTRKKEYEEKQKEISLAEPVEEGITLEDTLEDPTSKIVQMTLSSARENLQNWLHMKKPDLEEVVLRVFDLKIQDYTHEQIAEVLNQEGYTSKGKLITRYIVNNYVNTWIKPALAQYFEAFRTASLNMRKKAQGKEDFLIETKVGKSDWCDKCSLQKPSYRLDIGGDAGIYLCEECWEEEMNYRQEQNTTFQRLPWPGKISIEVPYATLLNKYTEDEIFDIAAGRKTDVTKEEVEQAKDVISRGIVANRLSMRKVVTSVNPRVVANALEDLEVSKIDVTSEANIRRFLAYKEYDYDIIEHVITKVFGEEKKEERQGKKESNE